MILRGGKAAARTRSLECVQSVHAISTATHAAPKSIRRRHRQAPCWHMFGFCLEKRRLTSLRLRSAAFLPRAARAHASCVAWIASSTPGLRCTSCTEAAARAQAASIIRVTRIGAVTLVSPLRAGRLGCPSGGICGQLPGRWPLSPLRSRPPAAHIRFRRQSRDCGSVGFSIVICATCC